MGSLKEVRCQIYLAKELGFLSEDSFIDLDGFSFALERKLFAFINYVRKLD